MKHPNKLDQQLDNLRMLQQSYDQIAGAAEAYNVGKTQLAQAITSKGVETSPTETYPEMAEKVNAISQETYEINGGEMYAKQLFGSLVTPNYWNLYDVLAQLLSDGRLVNYGGILLAEYYRGYDSLALSGAGAGGAYVVSDKDSDGNFIMYTDDVTHVWNTEFDGKGNRWVAYCFSDEYHDFQITNTNTSPRSIFIGRKVGTIKCFANARTSKIVVPDGNELKQYSCNGYTQNFDTNVVIKNIIDAAGSVNKNCDSVYVDSKQYPTGNVLYVSNGQFGSIIIKTPKEETASAIPNAPICNFSSANEYRGDIKLLVLQLPDVLYLPQFSMLVKSGIINEAHIYAKELTFEYGSIFFYCNINRLFIHGLEKATRLSGGVLLNYSSALYLYIGYDGNDKNKSVTLYREGNGTIGNLSDIELQDGWCKPLSVSNLTSSLTEANMYAHILQRLKQDEPDCGDGVTITLGSTNLAKLTSQESIDLLDLLTNTYGYTFA